MSIKVRKTEFLTDGCALIKYYGAYMTPCPEECRNMYRRGAGQISCVCVQSLTEGNFAVYAVHTLFPLAASQAAEYILSEDMRPAPNFWQTTVCSLYALVLTAHIRAVLLLRPAQLRSVWSCRPCPVFYSHPVVGRKGRIGNAFTISHRAELHRAMGLQHLAKASHGSVFSILV